MNCGRIWYMSAITVDIHCTLVNMYCKNSSTETEIEQLELDLENVICNTSTISGANVHPIRSLYEYSCMLVEI